MSKFSKKILLKTSKKAIAQFQLIRSWNCSNDTSNNSLEIFAINLVKCASFILKLSMFFYFVTIISFFLFSRKSSCFSSRLSLARVSRISFFKAHSFLVNSFYRSRRNCQITITIRSHTLHTLLEIITHTIDLTRRRTITTRTHHKRHKF